MAPLDLRALKELHSRAAASGDLESRVRAQELLITQLMIHMTELSTHLKDYDEVQKLTRANSQVISIVKWGAIAVVGSALSAIGVVGTYQILGVAP